jgi:hypothetical protein
MKECIKTLLFIICIVLSGAPSTHAGNLHIANLPSPIISACGLNIDTSLNWPSISSSFSLTGVAGVGYVRSIHCIGFINGISNHVYAYSVDMSGMALHVDHCVKLLVYFGYPDSCDYDFNGSLDQIIQLPGPSTDTPLGSANNVFGEIEFVFDFSGNPCLYPGLSSRRFAMSTDWGVPKFGQVTIVHTYPDPAHGTNIEERVNVKALVPALPPPNGFAPFPAPSFQGAFKSIGGTNQAPVNGPYDFQFQLFDSPIAATGISVSDVITDSVLVADGLFNADLNVDPTAWFGSARWLDIAVRPSGSNTAFAPLGPRLPVSPAPQAIYAYTAGSVSGLAPGQGVTSLNGLTDDVVLQAGPGILLQTNGNTVVISTQITLGARSQTKTPGNNLDPQPASLQATQLEITELKQRLEKLEQVVSSISNERQN